MERIKQSIPLLGVNRAEPDLTVKDGSCEKLHNMRFDAGAWRNVEGFRQKENIADNGGFKIIYKHPATASNLYIALDTAGDIHEVRLMNSIFTPIQKIASGRSQFEKIFSFGYVLILILGNKEYYYILYGKKYVSFEIPEPPVVNAKIQKFRFGKIDFYMRTPHNINEDYEYVAGNSIGRIPNYAPEGGYFYTRITDRVNKMVLLTPFSGDYWLGAIAVMVAYRMVDGTVVSNSELFIFASDGGDDDTDVSLENVVADGMPRCVPEPYRTGIFIGSKSKTASGCNDCYILPQLIITLPESIDTRIVESVVIYSTRIVPIYDFEKTLKDDWSLSGRGSSFYQTSSFKGLFTEDVDLMQEPFYRIKEVEIRDLIDNEHEETLSYTTLTNAESLPMYEPTQSLHKQVAKCYYEYNGRLHKGNLCTQLFAGYTGFVMGRSGDKNTRLTCTIDIENTKKQVCRTIPNFSLSSIRRIISYPDYRATRYAIYVDDMGFQHQRWVLDVKLESCKGNNYAYAIQPPSHNAKYPSFKIGEIPIIRDLFVEDDVYLEPNRVQVSATNNMFSLPFANSYRVGLNEEAILAIATVVDELSATRFGAFPLYVFTDRGVWSLESGNGEVLYSNILPVNHDKIINPNTCTALETVFYITSKGVHALRGRSSQLISRELEQYSGELVEYLAGARIYFQFKYGDLIVYNSAYSYAYVYSMGSGFWSSRDMAGQVLNNDEIVTDSAVVTLADEVMKQPVECLIVTRPLKLGTIEFKRLETLIVRIMTQDCCAHMIVEGSNDCNTWSVLRDVCYHVQSMDARLRRAALSFKFLRLRLHLRANCRLSTTGVDVEFYPRFVGRLR